jgi:hypothetical protein
MSGVYGTVVWFDAVCSPSPGIIESSLMLMESSIPNREVLPCIWA